MLAPHWHISEMRCSAFHVPQQRYITPSLCSDHRYFQNRLYSVHCLGPPCLIQGSEGLWLVFPPSEKGPNPQHVMRPEIEVDAIKNVHCTTSPPSQAAFGSQFYSACQYFYLIPCIYQGNA
jgi:hypothetical protein